MQQYAPTDLSDPIILAIALAMAFGKVELVEWVRSPERAKRILVCVDVAMAMIVGLAPSMLVFK